MLRKKPRGNLSAKWQKIVFLFNDDTIHLWDAINPTAATYGVFVLSVVSLGGPSNSTTESRLIEEILPKELSSLSFVVNGLLFKVTNICNISVLIQWTNLITSWLVRLCDCYSLLARNRKLTRSKAHSFVCDSSQLVNKNHSSTMK